MTSGCSQSNWSPFGVHAQGADALKGMLPGGSVSIMVGVPVQAPGPLFVKVMSNVHSPSGSHAGSTWTFVTVMLGGSGGGAAGGVSGGAAAGAAGAGGGGGGGGG